MKFQLNNQQIIMIMLAICFMVLGYQIYIIKVTEYMSPKDKLKQRKQLHSETKKIEKANIPEVHISIDDMNKQLGQNELNNEAVKIVDKYGNISYAIVSKTFGNPNYFKPGTYRYGSANYIPTYEDSIFLSKTLNNYSFYDSKLKNKPKNKNAPNNKSKKRTK